MTKVIKSCVIISVAVFFIAFGDTGVRAGGGTSSLKIAFIAIGGIIFFLFLLYLTDKIKESSIENNIISSGEKKNSLLKSSDQQTKIIKPEAIQNLTLRDIEKIINPNAPFDSDDKVSFIIKNMNNLRGIVSGRVFLITEICDVDIFIPYLKFLDIEYVKDGKSLKFEYTFNTSIDVTSPFVKVNCEINIEKITSEMIQTIKIKEYTAIKKDLLVLHLKGELNLDNVHLLSTQLKMIVSEDTIQLIAS